MSQRGAIPTVLRAVPNPLLKRWFDDYVPGQFSIPWDRLGEREIEPLLAFHNDLPPKLRDEMDIDLQMVRAFASEAGMTAIKDMAKCYKVDDLMTKIPDDLDLHGRAMWVRVHEPEIFKAAATFLQLDDCQFWRCRKDVPAGVEISPDAKEKLGEAISDLLRDDGRGQCTTVEVIERNDVTYFVAYPDDFVRSENTHDQNGRLVSIAFRPTTQIIFAYDAAAGSFQTATKIRQPRKAQIEQVFSSTVLGWTLGTYSNEPAYELGHLKNTTFYLATDPVDNIAARIESIGLLNTATNRPLTVSVDRKNANDTIHRAIEEELGKQPNSLWHMSVKFVELKFRFPSSRYHRASSPTIKITPKSCNLNRLTSDRAEIIQKHLRMWGIDGAAVDQSGFGAVGS